MLTAGPLSPPTQGLALPWDWRMRTEETRGAEDRVRSPQKGESLCPQLWGRGPWTEGSIEQRPCSYLGLQWWGGQLWEAGPAWAPHPAGFLGPLSFAKLPSIYPKEQRGHHKEMLEHIWVQLSHLDVFSSMPLPLAIRGFFPLWSLQQEQETASGWVPF